MKTTAYVNPYVGPRSFQINETLYGRDRELRQLTDRLLAERIVLLHSPSGAGKSSLVQAGLIPALRAEGFYVHHVIRVNLERPLELLNKSATLADVNRFNRYSFSTLLSLEEAYPPDQHVDLPRLARMNLENYLEFRAKVDRRDGPEFLIFDQFEEILTIDPADRAAKNAFFAQLGAALKNRNRWALFAMREDYLGALEPYVRAVPTYFANTFRLDLLGVSAAREAIQKPAQGVGIDFTDEAANKLVDDLRQVQVQTPDGKMEATLGLYVEPVQLQVVCYRLWETISLDDQHIGLDDVASVGDVDQSLAEYYALSVSRAAQETGVAERKIREWFENHLITKEGIRGQVLMGAEASEGLENRAVRLLENAHIIRGEKRAGATWFELSHDRLIAPVRHSNADWFQQHLNFFQRQAVLWAQKDRSEGLLLRGKELLDAENEVQNLALNQNEQDFLAASRQHREQKARDRRQKRLITGAFLASLVLLVIAVIFSVIAVRETTRANAEALKAQMASSEAYTQQKNAEEQAKKAEAANAQAQAAAAEAEAQKLKAEEQAKIARVGQLAAQAINLADIYTQRPASIDLGQALLLSLEAIRIAKDIDPVYMVTARDSLLKVSAANPAWNGQMPGNAINLSGMNSRSWYMSISPDQQFIAAGGYEDARVWVWRVADGQPFGQPLAGLYYMAYPVVFSPDSQILAAVGCSNQDCGQSEIRLWSMEKPGLLLDTKTLPPECTRMFGTADFSPDGKTLAFGCPAFDKVYRWNLTPEYTFGSPVGDPLPSVDGEVTAFTFSPTGNLLAIGGQTKIQLWDLTSEPPKPVGAVLDYTERPISLAFNLAGTILAVGGGDKSGTDKDLHLWDVPAGKPHRSPLVGHQSSIVSLAFSADSAKLVSADVGGIIILWDVETGRSLTTIRNEAADINTLVFSQDGSAILAGAGDETHSLWRWDVSAYADVSLEALITRACWLAGRNLTPDEWMQYFGEEPTHLTCDFATLPTPTPRPVPTASGPFPPLMPPDMSPVMPTLTPGPPPMP